MILKLFEHSLMKTENQVTEDILEITMSIKENCPELSKYIEEMTVTIPNVERPYISIKILKDYYDSLNDLLEKYTMKHPISSPFS